MAKYNIRHNRHLTSPGEQWSVECDGTTLSYHGTQRDAKVALDRHQADDRRNERMWNALYRRDDTARIQSAVEDLDAMLNPKD